MDLLDLLFPKRCAVCRTFGSFLCSNCFSYLTFQQEDNCLVCNRPAIDGITHPGCRNRYSIEGVSASLAYNFTVKKLIKAFKYQPYLSSIKTTLGELFYEGLIQKQAFVQFASHECILVPIPLHIERLRKRGYNQAELLAKEMGKKLHFEVVSCLQRTKNTSSQFALKREERLANMKDAFIFKEDFRQKLIGKNVLLVDDLVTSGATMLEAAKILKRNGVEKVWGIALGHGK